MPNARKKILHKIRIGEISAVDKPAQEHATADIMKAAGKKEIDAVIAKNVKMSTAIEGHQHSVRLVDWEGRAISGGETSWSVGEDDESGHTHPWYFDNTGTLVIGESMGHRHEIEGAIKKSDGNKGENPMKIAKSLLASAAAVAGLITKFDSEKGWGDDEAAAIRKAAVDQGVSGLLPSKGPLMLTKADKASDDDTDDEDAKKTKEEMAKMAAIIDLPPIAKAHYDRQDADGKSAFLKMDETARDEAIAKAAEADPVIFKAEDGTEFRKSDDPRMVKMARRMDKSAKEAEIAKADAQEANIAKAVAEHDYIPGDTVAKTAIVKGIESIEDDELRKKAYESLKGHTETEESDFQKSGSLSKADVAEAGDQLNTLAKAYQAEHGGTFEKAYATVSKTEQGVALYKRARSKSA